MSGRAAREEIDVEALLIRAYRERQVHKLQAGGGERADGICARLLGVTFPAGCGGWSVGERVDSSTYAAKMAARSLEAWRRLERVGGGDALDTLHDVVLGLPDFYVELTGGPGFLVWDRKTAEAHGHRIAQTEAGYTITAGRTRGGAGPRAGEWRQAGPVRFVTAIVTSALVIRCAADQSRPVVADLVEVGRRGVYRGRKTGAVAHVPVYETEPEIVAADRATYAAWHAAIEMIAQAVRSLSGYVVTGPCAPLEPWNVNGLAGSPQAGDAA